MVGPRKEELHVMKIKEEENVIPNVFSCEGGKHMGASNAARGRGKTLYKVKEGRKEW